MASRAGWGSGILHHLRGWRTNESLNLLETVSSYLLPLYFYNFLYFKEFYYVGLVGLGLFLILSIKFRSKIGFFFLGTMVVIFIITFLNVC